MSILRITSALLAGLLLTAGSKKPSLAVRFHVEAKGNAGGSFTIPVKFVNPARSGYIESVPFATHKNIKAIYPIQNPDGSLGCVFQLDTSGAIGLRTVSTDRRGGSVVGFIATKTGTHQLIDLPIDKPIGDGIIYIPRGISQGEITEMSKQFPLIKATAKASPAPSADSR